MNGYQLICLRRAIFKVLIHLTIQRNGIEQKVRETIKLPTDLVDGDAHFKWIHIIADIFVNLDKSFYQISRYNGHRVPIVKIGHNVFQYDSFVGAVIGKKTMSIDDVLLKVKKNNILFQKKFIAIGSMDENWGFSFGIDPSPFEAKNGRIVTFP